MNHSLIYSSSEDASLRNLDPKRIDKSVIYVYMQNGSPEGAPFVVEKLFSRIGEEYLKSSLLRLYIITDIYLSIKQFAESLGIPMEMFSDIVGNLEDVTGRFETLANTKAYLIDLLEVCARAFRSRSSGSSTVDKAKAYILEHFKEDDLSLSSVAAAVNTCAPHFSAVFKKESGENFIDYLTSIRMWKAKTLLSESHKRINEIALEVGYSDYHYFARLFKRLYGQTPGDFRRLNEKAEKY